MARQLSSSEIEQALQTCADEPIHIPGTIQPMGGLLAYSLGTEEIEYASENIEKYLSPKQGGLLGFTACEGLGKEAYHALCNAAGQPGFETQRTSVGRFDFGSRELEVHAFSSGAHVVVDFEDAGQPWGSDADPFGDLRVLTREIQNSPNLDTLLKRATSLMRQISGYERVMIYKFDRQFNGEVCAESKRKSAESFLGLRFPHWDIPPQARAMMIRNPVRIICDVDQRPIPIRSMDERAKPLDISLSLLRGVSPVHMQYLRNIGAASTMTLSIVVEGSLWGIASFHHRKPRYPGVRIQRLLSAIQPIFEYKIGTLQVAAAKELERKVDLTEVAIQSEIDANPDISKVFPDMAASFCVALDAHGVAFLSDAMSASQGKVPDQSVLDRLLEDATSVSPGILAIENLSAKLPELADELNGCAGALVGTFGTKRAICVFREEQTQSVAWAGNPEKTIERVDGRWRLEPRGSFATYLTEVRGQCNHWTEQDHLLLRRLWTVANAAERRSLMSTLNRHQALMIDELNHRVRNILALVNSVSRQARRRYKSIDSYAQSLEARIRALAAAHEIGSGNAATAASVMSIIKKELAPYADPQGMRIEVTGADARISAENAPILGLVIHELATNAAKYGAISGDAGRVRVTLHNNEEGLCIHWTETGGPPAEVPTERGFGSTLIENALPHELGGTSELTFARSGVSARLVLPKSVLIQLCNEVAPAKTTAPEVSGNQGVKVSGEVFDGTVLVVEDNYLIAVELNKQITELGYPNVEVVSNAADALDVIDDKRPDLAIIDINLGGANTSVEVARRLRAEGVPFAFATGYGDKTRVPADFSDARRLLKPVALTELRTALHDMRPQN